VPVKKLLIISLFFLYNIAVYSLESDNCEEECEPKTNTVVSLAKKCKGSEQSCSQEEQEELMTYIIQSCSEMPENTHHINKQFLKMFISSPMLNTAFLRAWSWLNPKASWPVCVICLLNYPLKPGWEDHFSYCKTNE
jgi:hypothetical protein